VAYELDLTAPHAAQLREDQTTWYTHARESAADCSGGNRPPSVDDAAAILEASLASNGRTGEATVILMALHQVDAETAFAMLRAQSRRNSRTSRDVADRFVATRASVPAPRGSGGGGHTWSC